MTESIKNKKHSENADTFTSATLSCDLDSLDVAYCIVPWYQVWCQCVTISSFLWPLPFACDLHCQSRSFSFFSLDGRYVAVYCTKYEVSRFNKFEIWTIVYRELKWRYNDVITHSNLIKFKHKSTKGIYITKETSLAPSSR